MDTTQARYSDENGLELTLNGYRDITNEVIASLEQNSGTYSDMPLSYNVDNLHKVYIREAGDTTLVVQLFVINPPASLSYALSSVNGTVCGQNASFNMNMNHQSRVNVVEFSLNDTFYRMGFLPYDDDSTEFTEEEIIAILATCPEQ